MTKTLVFALVVSVSFLAPAPLAAQHPPDPVNDTIILPGGAFCAFDVQATVVGKTKTIPLPDGGFVATSPGLNMTLTNLGDTSKQVSLNITGAFHVSTDSAGITTVVSTGRSVFFNSSGSFKGIVVSIGTFTFTFADDPMQPVQELQGHGQLIDACALVS